MTGIATPFRRDARDFASASGGDLRRSKVEQVLATEADTPKTSGELPWRTAFGSALHLLRHRPNDEALAELARVYARDALARWLPGVRVTGATVVQSEGELVLLLRVDDAEGSRSFDVRVPLVPTKGGERP
jgi:phage baseplate assembly protein W